MVAGADAADKGCSHEECAHVRADRDRLNLTREAEHAVLRGLLDKLDRPCDDQEPREVLPPKNTGNTST